VSLKNTELFKTVIPTKMLEFMSCARPVLLGVEGQARKILEEAQAGLCYAPGNATALAQAVTALASDPGRCEILGRNGRRHILAHFSREQTARDYLAVLEGVWAERSGPFRRRPGFLRPRQCDDAQCSCCLHDGLGSSISRNFARTRRHE
jgi:hypothetical protein